MGRRGPLPKAKGADGKPVGSLALAEYVRGGEQAAVVLEPDVPPCPTGLLPEVETIWHAFWTSHAASWVDRGAHLPRLVRWIHDVDQYHRILADLRPGTRPDMRWVEEDGQRSLEPDPQGVPGVIDAKRPWLGRGSTGQIVQHPHTALLADLDQRIHRAEVEFGMTPYAAVRLAGAGVQGALTAQQLGKLLAQRGQSQPNTDAEQPWARGLKPA